jgi:hypothetical protein
MRYGELLELHDDREWFTLPDASSCAIVTLPFPLGLAGA